VATHRELGADGSLNPVLLTTLVRSRQKEVYLKKLENEIKYIQKNLCVNPPLRLEEGKSRTGSTFHPSKSFCPHRIVETLIFYYTLNLYFLNKKLAVVMIPPPSRCQSLQRSAPPIYDRAGATVDWLSSFCDGLPLSSSGPFSAGNNFFCFGSLFFSQEELFCLPGTVGSSVAVKKKGSNKTKLPR
jgi:hypothetical protein